MLPGFLTVALFSILVKNITAITDDQRSQIQGKFISVGAECLKEHPLAVDDITAFKEKRFPDGGNAPCFTACVFKNVGILDDKGALYHEDALENAKKIFDDEEELKKLKELLTTCSKVNDEDVSDGEKGCDRAKLAYDCLIEHSDKFGYNIDF